MSVQAWVQYDHPTLGYWESSPRDYENQHQALEAFNELMNKVTEVTQPHEAIVVNTEEGPVRIPYEVLHGSTISFKSRPE